MIRTCMRIQRPISRLKPARPDRASMHSLSYFAEAGAANSDKGTLSPIAL